MFRIATTTAVDYQSMLALEPLGGSSHIGSMLPCAQLFTELAGLRDRPARDGRTQKPWCRLVTSAGR